MKKQLSTVDKEAAKWVADSTPTNLRNSTVDKEAAKWVADSTPANLKNSTVDKEAAKMIADSTPGKQRNLSSIDIEARELFNLPSIASEDKADLASQTASLKAKLSGNKIGTLESAISNLKTKIQSN